VIFKLERLGGVAGIIRPPAILDTTRLEPARAAELEKIVRDSGFFDLPSELLPDNPAPDSFQYVLTINDRVREHTVTTTQNSAPERLRALLQALRSAIRSNPGAATH
jgi:emfourin